MSIENKLKELNIVIPDAPTPVGAYVAYKVIKNLVFISGQLPIDTNGKIIKDANCKSSFQGKCFTVDGRLEKAELRGCSDVR